MRIPPRQCHIVRKESGRPVYKSRKNISKIGKVKMLPFSLSSDLDAVAFSFSGKTHCWGEFSLFPLHLLLLNFDHLAPLHDLDLNFFISDALSNLSCLQLIGQLGLSFLFVLKSGAFSLEKDRCKISLTAVLISLSKLAFWSLNILELSSIFVSVLYLISIACLSHSASYKMFFYHYFFHKMYYLLLDRHDM